MKAILACAICGKAFEVSSKRHICCSSKCSAEYSACGPSKKEMLRRIVLTKKMPPRTSCRMYDRERHDCFGLTGLWCEWENCKFYKPRGGADEQHV